MLANDFLRDQDYLINEIAGSVSVPARREIRCQKAWGSTSDRVKFLHCGALGYGGSCFRKGTAGFGADGRIIRAHAADRDVIKVMTRVKRRMIRQVVDICWRSVDGRQSLFWGDVSNRTRDDMRDFPRACHRALVGFSALVPVRVV